MIYTVVLDLQNVQVNSPDIKIITSKKYVQLPNQRNLLKGINLELRGDKVGGHKIAADCQLLTT